MLLNILPCVLTTIPIGRLNDGNNYYLNPWHAGRMFNSYSISSGSLLTEFKSHWDEQIMVHKIELTSYFVCINTQTFIFSLFQLLHWDQARAAPRGTFSRKSRPRCLFSEASHLFCWLSFTEPLMLSEVVSTSTTVVKRAGAKQKH